MPTSKVAIIHDWLLGHRGGEKVLESICQIFPDADIFTLFYKPEGVSPIIKKHKITPSFLNRLPFVGRYYRYLLPLMPAAIESFDLSDYQLILSSSHCVAKGVVPSPTARHICYCHTPMRYAWDKHQEYFSRRARVLLSPIFQYLRLWDVNSSVRVDQFLANSHWVAKRIERYYRRSSKVVYPPVDTSFFSPPTKTAKRNFYLFASASAPYKRLDLAIEACNKLNKKLIVVGQGQPRAAGKSPLVTFRGRVSKDELRSLYQNARALLFPGEEDFGIAPVEALACGTPVIAFDRGGARESVTFETGEFFEEQTVDSLAQAILDFEAAPPPSESACQTQAKRFSEIHFLESFAAALQTPPNLLKSDPPETPLTT